MVYKQFVTVKYHDYVANSCIAGTVMVHDEVLNITCMEGYESKYKMSYDLYRCVGNKKEADASIEIIGCSSKFYKKPPDWLRDTIGLP